MADTPPTLLDRFTTWLANSGLYQPFRCTDVELKTLGRSVEIRDGIKIDCYCPACRASSVFTLLLPGGVSGLDVAANREKFGGQNQVFEWFQKALLYASFTCARQNHHTLRIMIDVKRKPNEDKLNFAKIGQHPSKAELLEGSLTKYSKVAEAADLKELTSATMCHANGLHVAAFVYIRRVFERRLEVAHENAKRDVSWDEDKYGSERLRMDERIAALAHELPPFMVEHRAMYKILSKGVHELTEEECAEAYDAMALSVRLILEQEFEQRERNKMITEAGNSIQKLLQKHGGPIEGKPQEQ